MLTVQYKGGEQKVLVPTNARVVLFGPADRSELKAGAAHLLRRAARGRRLAVGGARERRPETGLPRRCRVAFGFERFDQLGAIGLGVVDEEAHFH